MRCWPHSGFSVDNSVYVAPHDIAGLRRLAECILRCPFSLARVERLTDDGSAIYRSEKDRAITIRANCHGFKTKFMTHPLQGKVQTHFLPRRWYCATVGSRSECSHLTATWPKLRVRSQP
jgi:hypothetical protein